MVDELDFEDKSGFLILPAIGMTLVAAGIFLIVVAYYPDVIPYLITSLSPEPVKAFLLDYHEAFKPESLPHSYMLLIGLASISLGSGIMVYEYREYLYEKVRNA